MDRAELMRFIDMLELTGTMRWYELAGYVEVSGDVEHLPEPVIVERAFATIGVECRDSGEHEAKRRFSGRRGEQQLSCLLVGPQEFRGRRLGANHVTVEWRSNERISGDALVWHGRRWPMWFEEPRLYSASDDHFLVEGRSPPEGFAVCLARYQAWAVQLGFKPHQDDEPDLGADGDFANREYVVRLQDRGAYATLFVRRREPDEDTD